MIKRIGYDAGEPQRAKFDEDKKYKWRYPLIEWEMGRGECIESIRAAGLPLPGKSACFFCPNSKPQEILALPEELKVRAIIMEENADLTTISGLGRRWRWADLIRAESGTDGSLLSAGRHALRLLRRSLTTPQLPRGRLAIGRRSVPATTRPAHARP